MPKKDSGNPRRFDGLPQDVQSVCTALQDGLKAVLGNNLYGIYLYGAAVFPETKHIHDVDCHVVLKRPLNTPEKSEIRRLHKGLADKYPVVGDDLDVWYILLDDARQAAPPRHQVYPGLFDNSWALHYAHMRAGYCVVLFGPEPGQVFPAPIWSELATGLEAERLFIEKHLSMYPDFCVLNLCRLLYSHWTKDVVVSKRTSAEWALNSFPDWGSLIEAALRSYGGVTSDQDKQLLESETVRFYQYACDMIGEISKG